VSVVREIEFFLLLQEICEPLAAPGNSRKYQKKIFSGESNLSAHS